MSKKAIAYHGSVWEKPLIPNDEFVEEAAFFDLDVDRNELKALFVSNNQSVCDGFGRIKFMDDENQVQVMIQVEVDSNSTVTRKFELGKDTEYKGKLYNYSCDDDRERLYNELRKNDVQCFIMENDYETSQGGGNDIAVLDNEVLNSISVKMKINGEWSKPMGHDEAKTIMKDWSLGNIQLNGTNEPEGYRESDFQFGY